MKIDNLAAFDKRLKGLVVKAVTPKIKIKAEKFADNMVKHIKTGYGKSWNYGIKPISEAWAKRRGTSNKHALFWTGAVMRSITRTPVKVNRLIDGRYSFSFKVYPKSNKHPDHGKTDVIAAYHETHGRPIWKAVIRRHYVRERNKVLADI